MDGVESLHREYIDMKKKRVNPFPLRLEGDLRIQAEKASREEYSNSVRILFSIFFPSFFKNEIWSRFKLLTGNVVPKSAFMTRICGGSW